MRSPPRIVTSLELFNLLQHQSNWPSGGSPVCLDLRESGSSKQRIIRGSHRVELTSEGEVEVVGASDRSWMGRDICLIDAEPASGDHAIALALLRGGGCRELLLLSEPFSAFESAFPFMCAKQSSSKAAKRPLCPSCVLPGLLYLGDLTDAAALPRLREQLNIQHALTALAELPSSLKASVSESGVRHTWCDVRDVEEADIKEHFGTTFDIIEAARAAQTAVFVHCSRGVSRSASLCIAYLMRREGGVRSGLVSTSLRRAPSSNRMRASGAACSSSKRSSAASVLACTSRCRNQSPLTRVTLRFLRDGLLRPPSGSTRRLWCPRAARSSRCSHAH